MSDYTTLENDLGRYFRSLPQNIQKELLQGGVVFHTDIDMRRCVQYLLEQNQSIF